MSLHRGYCQERKGLKMDDYFGVNVHVDQHYTARDFPPVVDWIRDYSDWPNFEPSNNHYTFTDGEINFDSAYLAIEALGVQNLIVIEDIPTWISPQPNHKDAGGFAPRGKKEGLQPEDYQEAAEFFYQFTARYGSKKVPKKGLKTKDKVRGLNVVDALEVMNEADGDTSWGNFVTIPQYAALLNAVYDGNRGKMGPYMGIKAADPDMPVSITGLGGNLPSLKRIVKAAGRAPFDIVNLHFYAFRYVRENYRVAVPPEWSSLEKDISETVNWVKENIPGKKIWLTEMGWDSNPNNTEAVSEQESADYLIRSYLIALGAGAEKCFWYYWRDYDDYNPIVFSSMGLFENSSVAYAGDTQFKPKLQYWYLGTMRNLLKDTYFIQNNSKEKSSMMYEYQFETAEGDRLLKVLWHCPDYEWDWKPLEERSLRKEYQLSHPGPEWKVGKVVKPVAGTFSGEAFPFTRQEEFIQLELGSTPVFVEYQRK